MSAETPKYCKDCVFGQIIAGNEGRTNIGFNGRIRLGFINPQTVERNCLSLIDRFLKRKESNVRLFAYCEKPEKYSPIANNKTDKK